MITRLVRGFEQALRAVSEASSQLRHLDGIQAVMETHFGFEERQLVGLLDALDVEGLDVGALDKVALYGPIA